MGYSVLVMPAAEEDIDAITMYIATHDYKSRARFVAGEIRKKIQTLCHFPERGGHPLELLRKGNREYRETLFGPYRIFYRIEEKTVFVVAVADGRRDMEVFLTGRLGK